MNRNDPLFIDEKINFAMTHYQQKLDPHMNLMNDVFIGKLKEISILFENIISSVDPNFVGSEPVLYSGLIKDPYLNEYVDIL